MKIAVIGTGYVGLVTGTCLAESGNDVVCVDKIAAKIQALREGVIPIYEPGLAELVHRNARDGRLQFTTSLPEAIADADLIYIAVGTPQGADGGADLTGIWTVGREIAAAMTGPKTIVIKSTVPVGTNAELTRRMAEVTTIAFDVANNPEFLKEGAAIDDFNKPDRVVVGVRRPEIGALLHELYAPFLRDDRPFLVMTPESAEMTKYVANCLLATKISFINEMANLCEAYSADINEVREDRPRPADRVQFPVSGGWLWWVVFSQGRSRSAAHGELPRPSRANDGGGRRSQRGPEKRPRPQDSRSFRRRDARQDSGSLGSGVQASD